ncbi:MAG: methyltransferase domain-containing protein [Actinomycetales bacterium]|nr:methyltransferase domain-containing protein [Actinomycetales bacterium]
MPHPLASDAMDDVARSAYDTLGDLANGYPANHFALQQVLNVLQEHGARRLLEVGVGQGNAIPVLASAGIEMSGMDIKDELVAVSRERIQEYGRPADAVCWGDIGDATTYPSLRRKADFDALLALGILPHAQQELATLQNMRALLRPGGTAFVECRNALFSLFTFNRYSADFILDSLLFDAPAEARDAVREFLEPRLRMDLPPASVGHATYHNPLEVPALFRAAGFTDIVIRPFHYHVAPPVLEGQLGEVFRDGSLALENEPSGWRGLFLCSAFLVQATRPTQEVPA